MFRSDDGFNMYDSLSAKEKAQQIASMNEASEKLSKKLAEERVEDEKRFQEKIATSINFVDWSKTVDVNTKLSNSFEDTTVKAMLKELGADANQYWVIDGEVFNRSNSFNIVGFVKKVVEVVEENPFIAEFFSWQKIGTTEKILNNPKFKKLFSSVDFDTLVATFENKVCVWSLSRGLITTAEIKDDFILAGNKAGIFIGKGGCVIRTLSAIAGRRLEVK